jgi:hypothetical protein
MAMRPYNILSATACWAHSAEGRPPVVDLRGPYEDSAGERLRLVNLRGLETARSTMGKEEPRGPQKSARGVPILGIGFAYGRVMPLVLAPNSCRLSYRICRMYLPL